MRMKSDKYPNARPYRDRHGKRRWRYRKKGFTAELGPEYGGDEFERRYQLAIDHQRPGAARTIPGTLNDLVVQFYRLHFPNLEESTRKDYRAVIEPLRERHGHKRISHLKVPHVMAIKAEMSDTPQQANKTLKRLSQLVDLAVKLEWRTDNPVKAVDHYRSASSGFHTWEESEIAQFYDVHEIGTSAHLAMTLMLFTGAAKTDAVKLGPENVKEGRIVYRRQKTKKNPNGIEVSLPVHRDLATALKQTKGAFTFLQTQYGKPRTPSGLGTSMRKWCDKAGLPLCSSHGLRKAICRRIAEAGGTPFEIMSVSGHVSLSEAQRYCEAFGRKRLSDSAFEKMAGVEGEQNLTNRP